MTEDYLDDLVEMWHTTHIKGNPELSDFIISKTGWNFDQYWSWVSTGKIPEEET